MKNIYSILFLMLSFQSFGAQYDCKLENNYRIKFEVDISAIRNIESIEDGGEYLEAYAKNDGSVDVQILDPSGNLYKEIKAKDLYTFHYDSETSGDPSPSIQIGSLINAETGNPYNSENFSFIYYLGAGESEIRFFDGVNYKVLNCKITKSIKDVFPEKISPEIQISKILSFNTFDEISLKEIGEIKISFLAIRDELEGDEVRYFLIFDYESIFTRRSLVFDLGVFGNDVEISKSKDGEYKVTRYLNDNEERIVDSEVLLDVSHLVEEASVTHPEEFEDFIFSSKLYITSF